MIQIDGSCADERIEMVKIVYGITNVTSLALYGNDAEKQEFTEEQIREENSVFSAISPRILNVCKMPTSFTREVMVSVPIETGLLRRTSSQ